MTEAQYRQIVTDIGKTNAITAETGILLSLSREPANEAELKRISADAAKTEERYSKP